MYNKLYTYLTENNILFNLQFGFRCQHSTEHAIVELEDKILNGFSEEKYVLKVKVLSGLRATFQGENNK